MLRLRIALASCSRRQVSRPVLDVARLRLRAARSVSLPAGAIATLAFVDYSDTLLGGSSGPVAHGAWVRAQDPRPSRAPSLSALEQSPCHLGRSAHRAHDAGVSQPQTRTLAAAPCAGFGTVIPESGHATAHGESCLAAAQPVV
jgi:hypothetical protein